MSQQANTMHEPDFVKTGFTLSALWSSPEFVVMGKKAVELTLGQRIAQLRRDRGLTQSELAEKLGVSQPVVSDYENDVIRLPADVVAQIATLLSGSTDELLGLKPTVDAQSTLQNRRLSRRLKDIEKLPRRDQDALLRTIEAFIAKTT